MDEINELSDPSDPSDLSDLRKSPLWMVSQEPALNDFVTYLAGCAARPPAGDADPAPLVFERRQLDGVRRAFSSMILRGEEKLHRLSEALCTTYFAAHQISSVVFGEIEGTLERFVLTQQVSAADLYSTSDIDLGTRQLAKLRFLDGERWRSAALVANVVEYQPTDPNPQRIHKLISRIKAEEEIWNKVVDEIFGLDRLVRRDKQMAPLSHYVKDVFGLKLVVGGGGDVAPLWQALAGLTWSDQALTSLGIEPGEGTRRLEVLETKDYVSGEALKASGWAALKAVVRWWGKTFEIQVQPLRNYFNEQDMLTRESHAGFKARRENVRDEIAQKVPLFGFYQALLKWLFAGELRGEPAPRYPGIVVELRG